MKTKVGLREIEEALRNPRAFVRGLHGSTPPIFRDAYRHLNESLATSGLTPNKAPSILILSTNDPFIRALRQVFGKAKSVEGMRLGGQMIGDRFLEDGYVYRIA